MWGPGESFNDWKKRVLKPAKKGHTRDEDMTKDDALGIVKRFLPQ